MSKRVFIAIGSNLGDRWEYLRLAVDGLPGVVKVSPVYETEPVGGPENQGSYLNAVVELATDMSAQKLLALAHDLEKSAGRVRGEINGPRTLDVDILLYGNERIDEPDLQVPHPRMWYRNFVVRPLADLAPELLPEGWVDQASGQVEIAGSL